MTDPISPLLGTWTVTKLELTRLYRGRALRVAAAVALILVIAATISCIASW